MGYLIVPTLLLIFLPSPEQRAHRLEDFSRLSRAVGKEVSLVDRSGLIHEGIVEAATVDGVTLRVGSATVSFPRAEVASAERVKDGRIDGAIRGALIGAVLTGLGSQGCVSATACPFWRPVAVYAVAGYLLDASESNPQPLFRAPSASAATLKVSFRF